MATGDAEVIERVIQLWNAPPAERGRGLEDLAYHRNRKVGPDGVLAKLRERLPEAAIREAAYGLLRGVVDTYRRGLVPEEREMFLAGCFLLMAEVEKGLPLPRDLVRDILTYFQSVIWYRPVGDLAHTYLSESEVLDALRRGFAHGNAMSVRLSCIEGFRLYRGKGKPEASSERKENALAEVRSGLAALARHEDPLLRETAERAKKTLG